MHSGPDFLRNLAVLLTVAAATTVVFQRLRQPVVLGYLLAGLIVGPYVAVPLVVDPDFAHTVSDLGVILLMFSLGLEFSLGKLMRVGPTAGIVAVIQCSLMIWLGYATARALGWTAMESIFTGGLIAISSTTIIVKAFEEQGVRGKVSEIVFGVLIVEDLIAILLLAILTALAKGSGLSAGALALTVGRLAAFLVGLLVVGLLVVPRLMRAVVRLNRPETTVVASVGLCFAASLLARSFGYSVALGAFLAGSLVAESGEARRIEHLIQPVRDLFAAIFFVAVGMLIQPTLVAENWVAVVVLTGVVVVGKIAGVAVAAFLSGNGIRTSVQAGMSLAQIGEFSFIIAGVGLALGVVRPSLYPIAVAVSAVTTLTTPWLIRASDRVASGIDRRLPRALQTFAALYGSWVEQLRTAPHEETAWMRIRRQAQFLLVDVGCLAAIVIGASLGLPRLVAAMQETFGLGATLARWLVLAGAFGLCLPFLVGAIRVVHALGLGLAREAFPESRSGTLDRAAAPRRVLTMVLQLALLLLTGIPLVAVTQPFLPPFRGAVVLAVAVVVLSILFWRSTADLQGHVRAGVQVIAEALGKQARAVQSSTDPVEEVRRLLPGLGEPIAVLLAPSSAGVGKTLADLDLRGLTGATVLAITRGSQGLIGPGAHEVLEPGDVLALAGTHEAVEAARELLRGQAG